MIVASLTPERAQEHAENMASISDNELDLARHLQQLAFWGKRDYSCNLGFTPAPLYVSQAIAISREPGACAHLLTCLSGLVHG